MGRAYDWSIVILASILLLCELVCCSSIFEISVLSFDSESQPVDGADLRFCITHFQVAPLHTAPCTFFDFRWPLHNDHLHTMALNFTFRWLEKFSLIVEAFKETNHTSDRELLARFIETRTLLVGTEWTRDTLTSDQAKLMLQYRVICDTNYYGSDCETFCRPSNNSLGHWNCTNRGKILCHTGWKGSYCTDPICLQCKSNGTCIAPGVCKCLQGWHGNACDKCLKHPGCEHGRCFKANECICDEGWGGVLCNLDLNYCTNHHPCKNGGTCTNTGQGSYTCSCDARFMGKDCDVPKDPCLKRPCGNGATCQNTSPGNYTCTCPPGYFGPNCETFANICSENSCENGGTCIEDPDGSKCECPLGYAGLACEFVERTNCNVYPCHNGGTCINASGAYQCLCTYWATGERCETALTCTPHTCKNGGTCHEHPDGVACHCPPGLSGTHCQMNLSTSYCPPGDTCSNNVCDPSPCLNGGFCVALANGGYRCDLRRTGNVSLQVQEDGSTDSVLYVIVVPCAGAIGAVAVVLCLAVLCVLRRRRAKEGLRVCEQASEHRQNEINSLKCGDSTVIVNNLGLEGCAGHPPPKVVNVDPRTKRMSMNNDIKSGIDNGYHSPHSHHNGTIYTIEDHYGSPNELAMKFDVISATEV